MTKIFFMHFWMVILHGKSTIHTDMLPNADRYVPGLWYEWPATFGIEAVMFYNAIYHSNCSYNDKPGFLKKLNFSLKITMLSRSNDFRKLDDIKCNHTVRFDKCPSAKMLFFKLLMNIFNNIFVQIFFRGKTFVSVRISFLKIVKHFCILKNIAS